MSAKGSQMLSPIANEESAPQVLMTMNTKNEKDQHGFFKALAVVAYLYLIGWLFYQYAYAQGAEAKTSQCQIVEGYVFNEARPAFKKGGK